MEVCREWNRKQQIAGKRPYQCRYFHRHLFCHFLCGYDAGIYPYLYPVAWTGVPHPVRYSLYAVLNKGQKVWHGIPDRHYPWLAEFNHGQRCVGSDFWHHLWGPGRCNFAGRKISKLEVYAPW